jgi:hypothetical protein
VASWVSPPSVGSFGLPAPPEVPLVAPFEVPPFEVPPFELGSPPAPPPEPAPPIAHSSTGADPGSGEKHRPGPRKSALGRRPMPATSWHSRLASPHSSEQLQLGVQKPKSPKLPVSAVSTDA